MKRHAFPKKKPIEPQNSWEASFGKILTPLEEFVKGETNSGILLIIFSFTALIIANTPFYHAYEVLLESHWFVGMQDFNLNLSLHHWINDGLMTLFFFLVGLEIKREVLVGELSDVRKALLPVCAAFGGMLVPALFYYLFNVNSPGAAGWGIPMATDIAFAVTALVLIGSRCPKPLMTFLIALAIVDDMGAVLVIALFYTGDINFTALGGAATMLALLLLMNVVGIRGKLGYVVFGFVMWIFMYKSGVHATIAGILTALAIPARPKYRPKIFARGARQLLDRLGVYHEKDEDVLRNSGMAGVLQTMERGISRAQTPLQSLEHSLHMPVNFIIIPIFALANAAIPIDFGNLLTVVADPITLGIIVGLTLGKPIGITLATWLSVRSGLCSMPAGTNLHHIIGVGFLAGIGFTMSIFITELAFRGQKETLIIAKTGILFASIVAAVVGFVYLSVVCRRAHQNNGTKISGDKD